MTFLTGASALCIAVIVFSAPCEAMGRRPARTLEILANIRVSSLNAEEDLISCRTLKAINSHVKDDLDEVNEILETLSHEYGESEETSERMTHVDRLISRLSVLSQEIRTVLPLSFNLPDRRVDYSWTFDGLSSLDSGLDPVSFENQDIYFDRFKIQLPRLRIERVLDSFVISMSRNMSLFDACISNYKLIVFGDIVMGGDSGTQKRVPVRLVVMKNLASGLEYR